MGLDIYKCKILPKDFERKIIKERPFIDYNCNVIQINEYELKEGEDFDPSLKKLYELHKDKFNTTLEEYVNTEETIKKYNLPKNYYSGIDNDGNCLFDTSEGVKKIHFKDCVTFTEELHTLNILETGYQRRGMRNGYSRLFENDEYMIFNNEELLHMKKYVADEYEYDDLIGKCQLHSWELEPDEFIYFSW